MTQFEWQQEFDGTQPVLSEEELVEASVKFNQLVGHLILDNLTDLRSRPTGNGLTPHLNLVVDAPKSDISVVIEGTADVDPSVMIIEEVDISHLQNPWRKTAKVSSWYFMEDGVVVRQDIDTRPKQDPLAIHDKAGSASESPMTDLAEGVADMTRSFITDIELGFNRQPVHPAEIDELSVYLRNAKPL